MVELRLELIVHGVHNRLRLRLGETERFGVRDTRRLKRGSCNEQVLG